MNLVNMDSNKTEVVLVALSGGVDSAVAARLLMQEHETVIGVSHRHWPESNCCSTACLDRSAAQCIDMGIPYYPLDCMVEFAQAIVDDFVAIYQRGQTPNPCVLCNQTIRFDLMIQKFFEQHPDYIGRDYRIATGHYAKVEKIEGIYRLKRGVDLDKDQSYMLYRLSSEQLQHCLFPLGSLYKTQVREKAERWNLQSAKQSESQDICFVTDTYQTFLDQYTGQQQSPGDFVDQKGKVLGQHRGVAYYTRGQRKGLGLSDGPWYVVYTDVTTNQVVLGAREDLATSSFRIHTTRWSDPYVHFPLEATVQLRYHAQPVPVLVEQIEEDNYRCQLKDLSYDVSPGQSAVTYQEDYVVGGGLIAYDPV